jgi:hypothetical protein
MDLVKTVYRPLAMRAARQVLVGRTRTPGQPEGGRFTRDDVDRLLDAAWRDYDQQAPQLPHQPAVGSAMNVRLACFTLSFFRQLLLFGITREHAIELVSDASWPPSVGAS